MILYTVESLQQLKTTIDALCDQNVLCLADVTLKFMLNELNTSLLDEHINDFS